MEFIQFLQGELLLTGTLFALIILLIVNFYGEKFRKYEVVDTNGAVSLMDDDELIILDVREEKERSTGFISNDLNIPMGQVKGKIDSLENQKTSLFIVRVVRDLIVLLIFSLKVTFRKFTALKVDLIHGLKLSFP